MDEKALKLMGTFAHTLHGLEGLVIQIVQQSHAWHQSLLTSTHQLGDPFP